MKLPGLEPNTPVPPVRAAGLTGPVPFGRTLSSAGSNPSITTVFPLEVSAPNVEGSAFGTSQAYSRLETPQTRTEELAQLVRSLNLPTDALSSALVAFARYFSLSLDPVLLTKLRREALSLKTPRESAALAAAAAAGKGAALSPEALEWYAAAIDPNARREPEGGQGREGFDRRGRGSESSGEDEAGDEPVPDSLSGKLDVEALRKIQYKIDRNEPLLNILNSIPGKDGERWMVYPFQVSAGGKRFRVSVRVRVGIRREDTRLAVDVAGEDRRWLFVVNQPVCPQRDAGIPAETQVSLWPPPEPREREVLEREIREVLGPLGGRVILRDGEPFLAEWRNEALSSIDEEV